MVKEGKKERQKGGREGNISDSWFVLWEFYHLFSLNFQKWVIEERERKSISRWLLSFICRRKGWNSLTIKPHSEQSPIHSQEASARLWALSLYLYLKSTCCLSMVLNREWTVFQKRHSQSGGIQVSVIHGFGNYFDCCKSMQRTVVHFAPLPRSLFPYDKTDKPFPTGLLNFSQLC